jgi:hypothetical protein
LEKLVKKIMDKNPDAVKILPPSEEEIPSNK